MDAEDREKITCHVCRKMIPSATALHAEGQEYVLHFCDIGCLEHWQEEQKAEDPDKTNDEPDRS